jgi:hypothetical protein
VIVTQQCIHAVFRGIETMAVLIADVLEDDLSR